MQIVFLAEFTILQPIATERPKISEISFLCIFSAQV